MSTTLVEPTGGLTERVVEKIARREGVEPIELPPLYEAVDPDALEALFAPKMNGHPRVGQIRFPYAGYDVTVEFDGDSSPSVTIE